MTQAYLRRRPFSEDLDLYLGSTKIQEKLLERRDAFKYGGKSYGVPGLTTEYLNFELLEREPYSEDLKISGHYNLNREAYSEDRKIVPATGVKIIYPIGAYRTLLSQGYDLSGNDIHATINGTVTATSNGWQFPAAGTPGYLTYSDAKLNNLATLSVSLWAKQLVGPNAEYMRICSGYCGDPVAWMIELGYKADNLAFYNGGLAVWNDLTAPTPVNVWKCITASVTDGYACIYINGSLVIKYTTGVTMNTYTGTNFGIASTYDGSAQSNCVIGDFIMSSEIITEAQHLEFFTKTRAFYGV